MPGGIFLSIDSRSRLIHDDLMSEMPEKWSRPDLPPESVNDVSLSDVLSHTGFNEKKVSPPLYSASDIDRKRPTVSTSYFKDGVLVAKETSGFNRDEDGVFQPSRKVDLYGSDGKVTDTHKIDSQGKVIPD